jgi:alpha-tubulin suppressor-like RCC1 family protein
MKILPVLTLLLAGCLSLAARAPQIAATGNGAVLLIRGDASLWSWGTDDFGVLGRGRLRASPVAERVGTNHWRSVAGGNEHVLAIQQDGTLWSWGNNLHGQLGIGSSGAGAEKAMPVLVSSETNWAAVAGGPDCSFGRRDDGTLWAWGWNAMKIFGGGAVAGSDVPLQIGTNADWSALAVTSYVLALKRDGSLWAWGDNTVGQLGDGTTSSRQFPKLIDANRTWRAIAAGLDHSLAVTSSGELWAWGLNQFGELGAGNLKNSFVPLQIGTETNWTDVVSGEVAVHSLGLRSDGSLWGWGSNVSGQLGAAANPNLQTNLVPTLISTQAWTAVAASGNFTVAVRADGSVWTTGENRTGQLGDGTFDERHEWAPIIPTLQDDLASTPEGAAITVPVLANDVDASGAALTVSTTVPPPHGDIQVLADGQIRYTPHPGYFGVDSFLYTARDAVGAMASARVDVEVRPNPSLNHPPQPEADLASTDPGISVDINVLANDTDPEGDPLSIRAFTQGSFGAVAASGPNALRYRPVAGIQGQDTFTYTVTDPSGATATATVRVLVGQAQPKLVAGGYRTMLLRPDGTIWGWGANEYGQLGIGTTQDVTIPTQVGTDTDWRDMDGDWQFTVARKKDGSLWSWGANYFGQLGNGTTNNSSVPLQIGAAKDWAAFAVSRWHTVALKTDGTLWSWGMNYDGSLGTGIDGPAPRPTQVGADHDWSAVFAGVEFSLAKKTDSSLWGWGYDEVGQLGDSAFTDAPTPVRVSLETNWAGIFPGNDFVLARKADGTLWGWGENSFGELATGVMKSDQRFEPGKIGSPIRIGVSADWLSAAGGFSQSLALRKDGTLWSWGSGSLGLGLSVVPVPTQVGLKTDWVAVSAGEEHSVAIDAAGGVWVWGNNSRGQLGLGTRSSHSVPTLIAGFGVPGFTLSAAWSGGTVTLVWSSAAQVFSLETATNLLGPWSPVPPPGSSTGQQMKATVVAGQTAQFFRLRTTVSSGR